MRESQHDTHMQACLTGNTWFPVSFDTSRAACDAVCRSARAHIFVPHVRCFQTLTKDSPWIESIAWQGSVTISDIMGLVVACNPNSQPMTSSNSPLTMFHCIRSTQSQVVESRSRRFKSNMRRARCMTQARRTMGMRGKPQARTATIHHLLCYNAFVSCNHKLSQPNSRPHCVQS